MTDQLNVDVAKSYLIGYNAGLRAGLEKLDQAWAEINAEGGSSHNVDVYTQGYLDAIDKALEVIEKLGGMDPAERSKND